VGETLQIRERPWSAAILEIDPMMNIRRYLEAGRVVTLAKWILG
jgi:hypothetical protein